MALDEAAIGAAGNGTPSPAQDSGSRPRIAAPDEMTRVTVLQRVRRTVGIVTPLGWAVAVSMVLAWLIGWRLGWEEFMLIATASAVVLVAALAFTFGRMDLVVEIEVDPQRVVVGQRSAGRMLVANPGQRRTLASRMELEVGSGAAEFDVPGLAGGAEHEELFVLPTERRAVIPVGPATTVRGDPLGLLRRTASWTEPVPLFVHPRTVALGHLGAGLLRDLEGQPTTDLSPSDIAFHALREYEAGDDRRFIHWMTTARVGELMVRQFTDTRRAHLALVLDGIRSDYGTTEGDIPDHCEQFELAVSIAGSLGVRALSDEQEVSLMACGRQVPVVSGPTMLDRLAGVELGRTRTSLVNQVQDLINDVSGVSLAMVITGSETPIADIRAAMVRFPVDVRTVAIRVEPGAMTGFRPVGDTLVLTVASLDELGHLMWAVTQQ
ncbi:MAG: DUF58 domain-containing protein [Microthrixaceae bacterium]|nr:DUF58 domain-containing protein [Microthrixaceae bacterium]